MKNQKNSSRYSLGFTLLELVVVITIIAILAAITIVSYNSWRQSTATTQLKSDLGNAASAMDNYRNFNNGYPLTVPTDTFSPSSGVSVGGGGSSDGSTYCINAESSQFPGVIYHIGSTNSGTGAQLGLCPPSSAPVVTAVGYGCVAGKRGCSLYGIMFTWPYVNCPGSTTDYQTHITDTPSNYDSGWVGDQWIDKTNYYYILGWAYIDGSSTTYNIAVQARCKSGSGAYTDWTASGLSSYTY